MNYERTDIKKGITLHTITTEKYKTNMVTVLLTTELTRKNVTKEALIPAVLRLGTNNIKTQQELNKKLENMYGADFNCGVEKRGDNHILKFYIESICDELTLNNEELLKQSLDFLLDVVFNPLSNGESFDEDYTNGEKENLKRIIASKQDNKMMYSYIRCTEEMFKNKKYGLFEYGYEEDLNQITAQNLYQYYKQLLKKCKIDIYVSGRIDTKKVKQEIESYPQIKNLDKTECKFLTNSVETVENKPEKVVKEELNVTQGKVVIGMDIKDYTDEMPINVYNAILGGGSNSKLFQNVREKAGLAYFASSGYIKPKNVIFIRCGIEIKNYDKAISIIKEQLEDMKSGNFTDKAINDAKELIIASLTSMQDEQSSEISYCIAQEFSDRELPLEERINCIKNVTRQQIVDVANNVRINTIYFLKNK